MTIRTTIARTLVASTLALAAVGFAQPLAHGDDNVIADPNLQACMNEAAGRVDGTPITAAELNGPLWTWRLDCTNRGVQSVEGLQYASQLTEFALNSNQITGISPLSGLPNLTYLGLSDNQITDADVAGLKDLPNLQAVNLANNQITNVSTITKTAFPQLSSVGLAGNAITDLSPLTTLFTENNTRLPALDQIVTLSPTTVGQPQPIPSVTLLDTAVAYDPAMTLDGTTLAMTPADPSSLTFDGDLVTYNQPGTYTWSWSATTPACDTENPMCTPFVQFSGTATVVVTAADAGGTPAPATPGAPAPAASTTPSPTHDAPTGGLVAASPASLVVALLLLVGGVTLAVRLRRA